MLGSLIRRTVAYSFEQLDSESALKYGEKLLEDKYTPQFFVDVEEANHWAVLNLAIYSSPLRTLKAKIKPQRDIFHFEKTLALDVGALIQINLMESSHFGLSGLYFVESIKHKYTIREGYTVLLELSPAGYYAGFWVLGNSRLGIETRVHA